MKDVVYVDGLPHHYEYESGGIFIDNPEMPYRRCAFIRMDVSALQHMQQGGVVQTGGRILSMQAPITPERNGTKTTLMVSGPIGELPDSFDPVPDVWDELPRCFGYALGALLGAAVLGTLIGYVYVAFGFGK